MHYYITDEKAYKEINKIVKYLKDDSKMDYRIYLGLGSNKSAEARSNARDILIQSAINIFDYLRISRKWLIELCSYADMLDYIYNQFPRNF